jgi:hypothetical protein
MLLALSKVRTLEAPALSRAVRMGTLFTIAMLLHACLVKLQWFYRYEAALIAVGVVALAWIVAPRATRDAVLAPLLRTAAGSALVALLLLPLATRPLRRWRSLLARCATSTSSSTRWRGSSASPTLVTRWR